MENPELFAAMQQRYREGTLPWNQALPPPEVIALAETLPPGRALDLGCGTGRTGVYLAQRGWTCDGVDFVPEAIALAQTRAREAGVSDRAQFVVGSVTNLAMVTPPYDLAVDIGCMHNLRGAGLRAYAAEVTRVLRPGGVYLLFVHLADDALTDDLLRDAAPDGSHPLNDTRGTTAQAITRIFTPHFTIERFEPGQTTVGDATWASAWYWMRRTAAA